MSEVPAKQCLNCDAPLAGPFCSQCGQAAQDVVLPLRQVLADAVDEFLKWDSRVLRTLWPLLTRPGFLTTEYLAGRRVRYVAPLRLYFFISALSFLLFTLTGAEKALRREVATPAPAAGAAAAVDPREARTSERMLDWVLTNQGTIAFLMVPVTAGFLTLLYRKQRRLYVEHLVFAAHVQSFAFLMGFVGFLPGLVVLGDWLVFANTPLYAFFAMRRAYSQSIGRTLLKLALLGAGVATTLLLVMMIVYALMYELGR